MKSLPAPDLVVAYKVPQWLTLGTVVEAEFPPGAALGQLPSYLATRTTAVRVREVRLP
jgi:hypothetical protein